MRSRLIKISSSFILAFGISNPKFSDFRDFESHTLKQNSDLVECVITISNLKPTESTVYIAVFDNSETFMSEKRFKSIIIDNYAINSVSQSIELPKGIYGMAVFQDLNGNGKLDKNFIGIPSEPYGFSNNASGMFGPPSWADAAVTINREIKLEIDL